MKWDRLAHLDERVGLSGRNKDYGVSADSFATPDRIHTLAAFGFYADMGRLDAKRAGNLFSHQRNVARELRALESNGGVYIDNGASHSIHQTLDVAKEKQAVRVPPLGTCIRKMLADVAQRRRAQERIADRVTKGVAIGMADGAFIERNFDPSQNEFASHFKTMDVIADADAERGLKVKG